MFHNVRVLVDGVAFQYENASDSDILVGVLAQLGKRAEVTVLDRGGIRPCGDICHVSFPRYNDAYAAADSLLIQRYCDYAKIDVFISTRYTTPTKTPMVALFLDREEWPDSFMRLRTDRQAQERALCLLLSRRRVFISSFKMQQMLDNINVAIDRRTISAVDYSQHARGALQSQQADNFATIADHLVAQIVCVYREGQSGLYGHLTDRWAELRAIQAQVEF